MKKSVLFILHYPPPINGATVMGAFIKNSFVIEKGFYRTFINLATSSKLETIGKGGIGKILLFFKIFISVFQTLVSSKIDLCYMSLTAKGPGFYKDFLIVCLLKFFRKKIVFHFHNKGVRKFSESKINHLLYTFCFKNTKSILLSPLLYADISEFVKPEDVFYCPNGISDNFDGISYQKIAIPSKPCNFLFLSNMMLEKGVSVLLESCKVLQDRGLDFECHFIGAWSDFTEDIFKEKVSELKISDKVFAHGKKYNEEKLEYFKSADVFVFPSFYNNETFGLVLLEAMQASLPVITTYEGGIPDVVEEGKTAILVTQKSVEELADAMINLAESPDLRAQMGKAGRDRYEKMFTHEIFEKNLMGILQDISK